MAGVISVGCRCRYEWFNLKAARKPIQNSVRDEALGEIVRWIHEQAERFWTRLPDTLYKMTFVEAHLPHRPWDDIVRHAVRWSEEADATLPPWLNDTRPLKLRDAMLVRCIESSGHFFRAPDDLITAQAGQSFYLSEDISAANRKDAFAIFKCLRRYLTKHFLGNRVHLLIWLGHSHSTSQIRRFFERNPYARRAYAMLVWMQCTIWRHYVRYWFLQIVQCTGLYGISSDPTYHWHESMQGVAVFGAKNPAQQWISDWLNVSLLLNHWPADQEIDDVLLGGGSLDKLPFGPLKPIVEWWAWLSEGRRLQIGLYRRQVEWVPAGRETSTKDDRRKAHADKIRNRQEGLVRLARSPALWRDASGDWKARPGSDVSNCSRKPNRLLLGPGFRITFFVAELDSSTLHGAKQWMIRCVEFPICVSATLIRDGIHQLKEAVRRYITAGMHKATRTGVDPVDLRPRNR
ncbi:hypothetical protein [Roseateles albus]|uniref:Uncharacterized protein n=1 Tax=Roseateles albus TaxID=2987525 RepID=A0ABT5KKQ2_9BURK|nr:hypothetical protein [Roseateles albus]MDC8774515.1 hypothetical protein [Roseateles albus]